MSNVIHVDFKQPERGWKKITQDGVQQLQSIAAFLKHRYELQPHEIQMIEDRLAEVLEDEIVSKYQMTIGDKEI